MSELNRALAILENKKVLEAIKKYATISQVNNTELSNDKILNRIKFSIENVGIHALAAHIERKKIIDDKSIDWPEQSKQLDKMVFPDEGEFYKKHPNYFFYLDKEEKLNSIFLYKKINNIDEAKKAASGYSEPYQNYINGLKHTLLRNTVQFKAFRPNQTDFFSNKNLDFFHSIFDNLFEKDYEMYSMKQNEEISVSISSFAECFTYNNNDYKIIRHADIWNVSRISTRERTYTEVLDSWYCWNQTRFIILFNNIEVFDFAFNNPSNSPSKSNKKSLKDGKLNQSSIKTIKLEEWIEEFPDIVNELISINYSQIDKDINIDLGKYGDDNKKSF